MTQTLTKTVDQRTVYPNRTWEQFKLIQKGFEGLPGVRLSYYEGTIEILMPGRDHELFSRIISYLVMTFCFDRGIRCTPTGSMTQEREGVSSVQADESGASQMCKTVKPPKFHSGKHSATSASD
jgi:hypothetical protein